MHGARDEQKFLVLSVLTPADHVRIGVLAEITGMRPIAVDDKNGAADLVAVFEDWLVHERHATRDIPAAV